MLSVALHKGLLFQHKLMYYLVSIYDRTMFSRCTESLLLLCEMLSN